MKWKETIQNELIRALVMTIFFIIVLIIATIFTTNSKPRIAPRDYQIELTEDSVIVYDGSRVVGRALYDTSKLDSIILNDNK